MPEKSLNSFFLLPGLELIRQEVKHRYLNYLELKTTYPGAVCVRCASYSRVGYDQRVVRVRDTPILGRGMELVIHKRRFWCKPCKRPFTEAVDGILPGKRTTQRFRKSVAWACENFSDLSRVKRAFHCSNDLIYRSHYEQLELKRRKRLHPWPKSIGIDEHAFRRNKRLGCTEFASMIVDQSHGKVMEVVEGKTQAALSHSLASIPGRENVKYAAMDLCDPFKNFIREFFPNAEIVADKFHVLRLLSPAILKKRREITGTRADLRARRLLLMSAHHLDYGSRRALSSYLEQYPELRELYAWKERLHGFYRIRGFERAGVALTHMTDAMAASQLPEIKTLRRTLKKWRTEILNYFKTGLTNARTEGFNNVAKVIKRRSYGFRSFPNYRLRVLNACAS